MHHPLRRSNEEYGTRKMHKAGQGRLPGAVDCGKAQGAAGWGEGLLLPRLRPWSIVPRQIT